MPCPSAVFQAGGLVVVLVEVSRKAYLASIVPVIVNAILNEHQIIVDIVAFVGRGDFPRSRLGEKQRGKILAGWVSRKMRTVAQFSIKGGDPGATGAPGTAALPPGTSSSDTPPPPDAQLAYEGGGMNRGSLGSFRSLGVAGASSSLRNVEHAPQILEQRELEQQLEGMAALGGATAAASAGVGYGYQHEDNSHPQPPLAEMPAEEARPRTGGEAAGDRDGRTPPTTRAGGHARQRSTGSYGVPDFMSFGEEDDGPEDEPPHPGPKPGSGPGPGSRGSGSAGLPNSPAMRLPGVDGRESLTFDDWPAQAEGRNSLPGRQQDQDGDGGRSEGADEDDEWAKDAEMYMNLAGTLGRRDV